MHPPDAERAAELRERFAEEARAERPDLSVLCLLIGAAGDAALDERGTDEAQIELDRLAGELPHRPGGPEAWAAALGAHLGSAGAGFHGAGPDYERLESSLLHHVLRRRRGLPILLSVVWMEVARRAGGQVYGVALPGHFVVGFGRPPGPGDAGEQVLADPFDGGRVLTGGEAELLVAGATGEPLDPALLSPADPREVVLRILNNIRVWAATHPERSEVALWAVELGLLLPAHPASLRYERAQLLVKRGDFLTGAREMESYADVVEAVDEEGAATIREQARAARALLN
ncbi:tetratricopeptide repeat protein [Streptomyces sp. NA04227]|uniref:transglutaminase family protein n=1 Tax=Streptomyces sp. NA04227 TaxID=2742136 RepID=UPI0015928013|nr:transglutaminase-like domain-containing protein [Streptomyces sp. NA04227]QKW08967.1 tetratricopeptide repeat protein [Streptomyces sp. NA04227]